MRKSKTVPLTHSEITVNELTAAQVNDIMVSLRENGPPCIIDLMFPSDLPAAALALAVDLPMKDLEDLPPSEINALMEAAIEVNPFFFAMYQRSAESGMKIAAGLAEMPLP